VREDSCKLRDKEMFDDVSNICKVQTRYQAILRREEDERELQIVNDQQPKVRVIVQAEELCEINGEVVNKCVGDELNASDDVEAEGMSLLVDSAERDGISNSEEVDKVSGVDEGRVNGKDDGTNVNDVNSDNIVDLPLIEEGGDWNRLVREIKTNKSLSPWAELADAEQRGYK